MKPRRPIKKTTLQTWRVLLLAGLMSLPAWLGALDQAAERNKRLDAAVAGLSDERFTEREAAARYLEELGPDAFARLKQLMETTAEQELRLRLRLILKRMALTTETDPETLAQYGREEAEAQRFMASARYYARAAEAFRSMAARQTGEDRALWEGRAQRATQRAQHAEEWAQALLDGRVMEQAGRSFIILTHQAHGQTAVQYREIDLQSLINW